MSRLGFSLLELIVAIAVLGLVVGIVAVAPFRPRSSAASAVQAAVATSLASGRTIVAHDSSATRVVFIAAYPSGIVVTDTTYAPELSSRADSASR